MLLNPPNVVQDSRTSTWTCTQQPLILKSLNHLPAVDFKTTSEGQHGILKPAPQHSPSPSSRNDVDTSMSDSSPELEIMEVRKIKRSAQGPSPRAKVLTGKPRSNPASQSTSKANIPAAPVKKRESFDMSLIDPALRDVGATCKPGSVSARSDAENQVIGVKRPAAETGDNIEAKRLKETVQPVQTPSPFESIHNSIEKETTVSPGDSGYGSTPQATPSPPPPQWLPNTWSKQDYIRLVTAVDNTFNYRAYGQHVHKHPMEIADVFRGIVITPILDIVDAQFPTQIKEPPTAEHLMTTWKSNESKLSTLLAEDEASKLKVLKARALVEIGSELRVQIEAEIRTQLKTEGWVQLNKAKDLIAGYEREIAETKPSIDGSSSASASSASAAGSDSDKKLKPKVKPLLEAQKDLLAASIMFEKARKADERKSKLAEREAKGESASGKKLGRPKKGGGEGKGKGADFI